MKKSFILLALSLTMLSASALSRRVDYAGYRIGSSDVMEDQTRIYGLPCFVHDSGRPEQTSIALTANQVPGQKIVRWWAYESQSHTQYNNIVNLASGVYSFDWKYNTASYSSAFVVVDYDYIKYNLSYNANGGSGTLPSSLSDVIYTNEVVVASNLLPAKRGYTWSGWTNNLTTIVWRGGEKVTGESLGLRSIVDGSNVVLYAKWTPNSYTVTLDPCDGSVDPESVDVTYDAAWPALPTPTREGYYFDGWYNDDSYNTATPTNSTVAITGDATIYAKWTRRLTATFIDPVDSNTQLVYVAYGSTPTAPFTPNHSGYTFSDWSPKLGSITQDTVYTAQFTGTQYFITYHSNFGIPEETRKIDYVYGTAKAALNGATEFPRTGYTFAGWSTSADSDQIRFHAGEDIVTFSTEGDALYAVWEPIEYSISFDANGGEGKMDDASVEYGETYTVTNCTFTKAGVEFTGWTTNLAVSAEFKPGDAVSNLTATAGATVTFYAVWSEPRYIAFDGNGADNPDAMDIVAFDGIETNALPQCEFAKTGYTFGGWATNAVAATNLVVAYKDKADVISTNLWMAIGETNTFFAVWQTNLYTVVFNANGGAGEMEDQTFCYDQGQALSKCAFTSSLMFMGWATNETDSAVYADGEVVTNLTAEAGGVVNLYAVWNNGDLSKAMHCDNLVWISSGKGTEWEAVEGSAQGYNGSGSAAKVSVAWSDTGDELYSKELSVDPLLAGSTSGKLSFWYKTGSIKSDWYSISIQNGDDLSNVELSKNWKQYGPVFVDNISSVKIKLSSSEDGDNCTLEIDQMKWVPGGAEPTEDDRPTINGFTAKDGGFTLSVDGDNISDLFSYQILATNELVKGDWPVNTNLTADAIKAGFDIVPEAGEPKMFYKVKVVPKQ